VVTACSMFTGIQLWLRLHGEWLTSSFDDQQTRSSSINARLCYSGSTSSTISAAPKQRARPTTTVGIASAAKYWSWTASQSTCARTNYITASIPSPTAAELHPEAAIPGSRRLQLWYGLCTDGTPYVTPPETTEFAVFLGGNRRPYYQNYRGGYDSGQSYRPRGGYQSQYQGNRY
jgi:hypothetical protein